MNKLTAICLLVALSACSNQKTAHNTEGAALAAEQNITWNAPANNSHGSMPLGNGDIGLNVWTEESGDLCFYISKTDSWDESGRLLKVGKVRLHLNPNPFLQAGEEGETKEAKEMGEGRQFQQILKLEDGSIEISAVHNNETIKLHCWVDANNPVITIDAQLPDNMELLASTEIWRSKTDTLKKLEISDLNFFPEIYGPTTVAADQVLKTSGDRISWLHHNPDNPGFYTHLKEQGMEGFELASPLKDRIFGASMSGKSFTRLNDSSLVSREGKRRQLNIAVLTQHPSTTEKWTAEIDQLLDKANAAAIDDRYAAHRNWWQQFWNRSWISVESTDTISTPLGLETQGKVLTRAYTLQRFITACAGRGKYPIKFNGSLFTVEKEGEEGFADYRRWGTGYWWQNTRMPVIGMLASGDEDLMQSFFNMYNDQLAFQQYRTRSTLNQEGAYFAECLYFWGGTFTESWGKKPLTQKTDKIQESGWHKYEWVSGLELVSMMMDYYRFTRDETFAREKLFPVARQLLLFFDQYYKKNEAGKLVFYPSQALETWWLCTNAMPEVAGLHWMVDQLPALPGLTIPEELSSLLTNMKAALPALPTRTVKGKTMLAPADKFETLMNVENPELYAVFPFRLYGIGSQDIDLAIHAWHNRDPKGYFGWRQDDLWAALLGLTDEAAKGVLERSANWDRNHKFPAFWGPNYDWTPDQCHGGALVKTLQQMLLQYDGDAPKVFPAWPKQWDVKFKLHAPDNKVVNGSSINGETSFTLHEE